MSTAEILFNDSEFALLPGQEIFVKSKVLISGMGGVGQEEAGVVELIFGLAREASGKRSEACGWWCGLMGAVVP